MAEKNEFIITRLFAAPRPMVWAAFTDPAQLAAWWGPHGFTNRCQLDLRVGGAYRIVMRGPDGVEYPMKGVYREVVAPERLVYTSDMSEHPDEWHDLIQPNRDKRAGRPSLDPVTTVTFEDADGGTRITVTMRFPSAALRDAFVKTGMNEGWSQSFERLDTLGSQIVATRLFNAPRALVWKMWTDREHVVNWWGPKGFTSTISIMDVKPGGVWQFVMHGPDGVDYQNKNVYVEVVAPERLVFDHVSGPLFRMSVSFADESGQTRVDVRMQFASAEERDKVAKQHGAVEGLQQTLGRLQEILARAG